MTAVEPVPLIVALNERDVPYVVIGGFAVIAHGYVRSTEDLDVLVPATPGAIAALRQICTELGATDLRGDAIPPEALDGERHVRAHTPHGVLDIVPEGESPFTYEEIARESFEVEFDGHRARIAGLAHLVALKRIAGRTRDRADLEALAEGHGTLPEIDGAD